MFSSRWLQSALPHVDGPGVGAILAWGQHSQRLLHSERLQLYLGAL